MNGSALSVVSGWDKKKVRKMKSQMRKKEMKCRYRQRQIGPIIVLLVIGLLSLTIIPTSAELEGWQYQREFTIRDNSGTTLDDYQVMLDLLGNEFPVNAKSDGADIRFTDADGTELSYWIESWYYSGKGAKIWVKVPSIPANGETKITMYYGNPTATSKSNGDATFVFFDDFETGLDQWEVVAGETWVIVNDAGKRVLKGSSSGSGIDETYHGIAWKHVINLDPGIEIRAEIKNTDPEGPHADAGMYWGDTSLKGSGYPGYFFDIFEGKVRIIVLKSDGTEVILTSTPITLSSNKYYKYTCRICSDGTLSLEIRNENDAEISSISTRDLSLTYVNTYQHPGIKADFDEWGVGYWDNFIVRKYTFPEPTITIGAEQLTVKVPSLTLAKSANPLNIHESDATSITIEVENKGSAIARDIEIIDSIHGEFTLVSGSMSQNYDILKQNDRRIYQYTIKATKTGSFVTDVASGTYNDEKGNSYSSASNSIMITVEPKPTPAPTPTAPPSTAPTITTPEVSPALTPTPVPAAPTQTPTPSPTPSATPSEEELPPLIPPLYISGAVAVIAIIIIAGIVISRKGKRDNNKTKKPHPPAEPPKHESKIKPTPPKPEQAINSTSAFGYKGATIVHKIKVENSTSEPMSDIKIHLFVPEVFLLKEHEKHIGLLKPRESKTVTFEIRPTGECGDCEVSGSVIYYDYASKKTIEVEIPAKTLSIVCPLLKMKKIDKNAWNDTVNRLIRAEESTKEIQIPAEAVFTMTSRVIEDMNMFKLEPEVTSTPQLFNGVARFYAEGVKELKYATQIEVVGGAKKSKLILKAWAEKEEALTGFYFNILAEIEKRIGIKDYNEDIKVFVEVEKFVGGDYQERGAIKAGGDTGLIKGGVGSTEKPISKCPHCGGEVSGDERFCHHCGKPLK